MATRKEHHEEQARQVEGLSEAEIEKLCKILDYLEWDAYQYYKSQTGAFAEADVYDYNEEIISVSLKFGIQSDVQDTVHTEDFTVLRDTMEIKN